MLLLMAAILAISAVVQTFDSAYGFESASSRDSTLMAELRAIPMFRTDESGSGEQPYNER
jgi:hypothetical protein